MVCSVYKVRAFAQHEQLSVFLKLKHKDFHFILNEFVMRLVARILNRLFRNVHVHEEKKLTAAAGRAS